MKDWEYNVSIILSVLCIVLSIWIISTGRHNAKLQAQIQAQQSEIEVGNASQQWGLRLIQDMVALAPNNPEMRAVLSKNGITVPPPRPAAAVETATKAPAATGSPVRKSTSADNKTTKSKSVKKTTGK